MKKGILFALATATISGFSIFLSKIFIADMDPVVYTVLKNGLVALILTGIIVSPRLRTKFSKFSKSDWIKLISIGVIGGSIPFALFFTGLKITESANAAIIHKTLFIWVAAFAVPFLKEKINVYQAIGYLLVLFAAIGASGIGFTGDRGEQMIFVATILWAVENVIAKITLQTIPSEIVAWARMTFGSVVLIGIVAFQGNLISLVSIQPSQFLAIGIATALLTGYVLTWYKALSYAPATIVSSILVLSVPITTILSAGFPINILSSSVITSTLLPTVGIVLISLFSSKMSISSSRKS